MSEPSKEAKRVAYDLRDVELLTSIAAGIPHMTVERWAVRIQSALDQARAEEREANCKAMCPMCARGVPFADSTLGPFTHADSVGWDRCRAAAIRARGRETMSEPSKEARNACPFNEDHHRATVGPCRSCLDIQAAIDQARPKIDDVLSVVWSQHLEADYVCTLKHCPFCRFDQARAEERLRCAAAAWAAKTNYDALELIANGEWVTDSSAQEMARRALAANKKPHKK